MKRVVEQGESPTTKDTRRDTIASGADDPLTVGEVAKRSGIAPSAVRFYEKQGLIASTRTHGNQRRYPREVLRRIAFVRAAQQVGIGLDEVRAALDSLPDRRAPTSADWSRLARSWRPRLDERIATLVGLRDQLTSCIGCGCLSLKVCKLYNPGDLAGTAGEGARYLHGDRIVRAPGEPPRIERAKARLGPLAEAPSDRRAGSRARTRRPRA